MLFNQLLAVISLPFLLLTRMTRLAGACNLSRLTSLGIIAATKQIVVDEGDFPALQKLTLKGLKAGRLMCLAPLFQSGVTEVRLMGTWWTPLCTLLKPLSQLRALAVVGGHGGSIVSLLPGRLRRLTLLIMENSELEDRHARKFSRLHELRSLVLDMNREIALAFLKPLTGLTKLSRLSLDSCVHLLPAAVPAFCSRIDEVRAAYGWPPLKVVGLGTVRRMEALLDVRSEGSNQHGSWDPWDPTSAGLDPAFHNLMARYYGSDDE